MDNLELIKKLKNSIDDMFNCSDNQEFELRNNIYNYYFNEFTERIKKQLDSPHHQKNLLHF